MINNAKWSSWSLRKSLLVGILSCFIFAGLRLIVGFSHGMNSIFFDFIDSIGFITLILIASRFVGTLLGKIVVFALVFVITYMSSMLAYFIMLGSIGAMVGVGSK